MVGESPENDVFPADVGWSAYGEPTDRAARLRRSRRGRAWLAFYRMTLPAQVLCVGLALVFTANVIVRTGWFAAFVLFVVLLVDVIVKAVRAMAHWAAHREEKKDVRYAALPNRSEMLDRAQRGVGDAFPVFSSPKAARTQESFSAPDVPSWRSLRKSVQVHAVPAILIEGAGPLSVSDGTVVDALRLRIYVNWYVLRKGDVERTRCNAHWVHFVRVRFHDDEGRECVTWSNAVRSWFGPGEAVAVYWYRESSGGVPRIRVHDVARAAGPRDVRCHAASAFAVQLLDGADALAFGNDDESAGSFGETVRDRPWGREYLTRITRVGYPCGDKAVSDRRRKRRRERTATGASTDRLSAIYDVLPDDIAVDPDAAAVARDEMLMSRHAGIVRRVAVVPLFNRRSFCGYGYMALVECAAAGLPECWAFGDPRRKESYLGWRMDAAVPPVRPGDTAYVWVSDEMSFVEPAIV